MYTVRIFFAGMDAKFDAKIPNVSDSIRVQKQLEEHLGYRADVVILPPKDDGKTVGDALLHRQVTPDMDDEEDNELVSIGFKDGPYIIEQYNHTNYIIHCLDPSICTFWAEPTIQLSDTDSSVIGEWDYEAEGWVVEQRYYHRAVDHIYALNYEDHYRYDMDYDDVDYYEYREYMEAEEMRKETQDSAEALPFYVVESTRRGYAIRCTRPDECVMHGSDILYLTDKRMTGPTDILDRSTKKRIGSRRDKAAADQFVAEINHRNRPMRMGGYTPPQ